MIVYTIAIRLIGAGMIGWSLSPDYVVLGVLGVVFVSGAEGISYILNKILFDR